MPHHQKMRTWIHINTVFHAVGGTRGKPLPEPYSQDNSVITDEKSKANIKLLPAEAGLCAWGSLGHYFHGCPFSLIRAKNDPIIRSIVHPNNQKKCERNLW